MRPYADLFCMGAAFLLLETKNVIQFALLFGTTWFVNALVFGGVLVTVLAAVEVARRVRIRRPLLLYAACSSRSCLPGSVPQATLLELAWWPRLRAAVAFAFAPIFIANLIFAERFRGRRLVDRRLRREPARRDGRRACSSTPRSSRAIATC